MAETAPPTLGWRSLIAPGLLALPIFGLMVGLGVWQVERLHWKEGILAQIDARTHAAPVPTPEPAAWPSLKPDDYEYRRVSAKGFFEHERESYIFRSGNLPGQMKVPGYHVLTPLRIDGARILVNRGFVPQEKRDAKTRPDGLVSGETTVTGLMRSPEDRNMFTTADNPAERIWFTRDPASVATALGLANVAPFVIDADDAPGPGGLPHGGVTEIVIPNNHLSYAATWFGLAATLVGVFFVFAWRRLRG